MKTAPFIVCLALICSSVLADPPVITSFDQNGIITWTNSVNTSAIYRVEWLSTLVGTSAWRRTCQELATKDGRSNMIFTTAAPIFFRVVMETNQPPTGMVYIDAGDVELGLAGAFEPVHTNFISGFYIDQMKVSKKQWDSVYSWAITNGYTFISTGDGKDIDHPVNNISWFDAVKWCNARSEMEGLTPCYYTNGVQTIVYRTGNTAVSNSWVKWTANGYRLPTEAEWEKAARGGRQGKLFPWGTDSITQNQANYDNHPAYTNGGTPYTSPGGAFPANGFGVYDMAGNLWEWAWDWYGAYASAYQIDPVGPSSGTYKTLRNGCWAYGAGYLRCASRSNSSTPLVTSNGVGFRCVRRP